MENKILFWEKQKFTQWWLWLFFLAPIAFLFYKILMGANDSGNLSISLVAPLESWIAILILLLILVFVFFATMKTTIDDKKIVVQHLYFVKKTWFWQDIESVRILKYGFVGYGIRISLNLGTVYNVKGDKGLLLKFKSGKKVLIGTQKPEALAKVVSSLID